MNKLKYHKVIDLIDEDIIKEAEIKTAELSDTESGNDTDVSGVERYRGIAWHRLTAAASAVLLIAGIGSGGALMLKKRPPLLDEVNNVAVTETTENIGANANGSGETAEVTSDHKVPSAASETDTKESKDTTAAEKDKESAGRDHCYPEDSTEAPREDNNEPDGREEVTTAAKTTQLPVLRTTVTKEQTTQKLTTTEPVVYNPTEPHTERTTPQQDPGYIPYLSWYPEDGSWIMSILSGLSYTPWSYDVTVGGRPPEGYINGSDGNAYALCFSERWVRRNWCEQAYMPDEIYNYFVGSNARGYTTLYD